VSGPDDLRSALYDANDLHDFQVRSPLGNLDKFHTRYHPHRPSRHSPPRRHAIHFTVHVLLPPHTPDPQHQSCSCPTPIPPCACPFHSMHHGSTHASLHPPFHTSCNSQLSTHHNRTTTAPHLTQHSLLTRDSELIVFHHIRIALDGPVGPAWSISHKIVLYAEEMFL
jgi:hypothetical protein